MGRAKGEDKCAKTIGMTNNKCGNTRLLVIPKRKCGKANWDRGETPVYRTKIDRGEDQKRYNITPLVGTKHLYYFKCTFTSRFHRLLP